MHIWDRKKFCLGLTAALLTASSSIFVSCRKIDEEAPEQIYYI